jgi:hypothetical protein
MHKLLVAAAAVLTLTGCATADIDQAVNETNAALADFTGGKLELARTEQQRTARERLAADLLSKPLSMDDAVQVAMVNSPAVQALIAQSWLDMARASQAGRIANPIFTFERVRLGDELEIGRLLSIGLLDILTHPQRQVIARNQIAQARVQLAARAVEQVNTVRQAWVRAVASQQSLAYAHQVNQAAEASAELARRMQQVGNFTKLQRARQQAFYADAAAQLTAATHARTAAREELLRQLGLSPAQAALLKLPERLPDLPKQPLQPAAVTAAALDQRLDVQLARLQLDVAGRAQRLNLLNTVADVEVGGRRDTVFDDHSGSRETGRGYEVSIRLPLFDWGDAQRASMNAETLAAATRYEATARSATSQLRESYSAYRTAYELARHYRDEIVPLRKTISEENQLRYNGMLIGVFELLADTRDQITTVNASVNALQQFWLAQAGLASAVVGRPITTTTTSVPAGAAAAGDAGH